MARESGCLSGNACLLDILSHILMLKSSILSTVKSADGSLLLLTIVTLLPCISGLEHLLSGSGQNALARRGEFELVVLICLRWVVVVAEGRVSLRIHVVAVAVRSLKLKVGYLLGFHRTGNAAMVLMMAGITH